MINIIVLGANSYLFRKFIMFLKQKRAINFDFYLFSTNVKKLYSLGMENYKVFDYSQFDYVVNDIENGFILNFAGQNVFKTLFSFKSISKKNEIIWKSRINFTMSIVRKLKGREKDFIFFIPSAVWVYSSYLKDYFLLWEDAVKDFRYFIFRLGIVLDYDCQWVSVISKFLKYRINLVFPENFIFPFVWIDEFNENLFRFLSNFSESKIIDLFYVDSFNNFVSFVKDYFGFDNFFLNIKINNFLLDFLFGDYSKVFFNLEIPDIKKRDVSRRDYVLFCN